MAKAVAKLLIAIPALLNCSESFLTIPGVCLPEAKAVAKCVIATPVPSICSKSHFTLHEVFCQKRKQLLNW